MITEAKIPDYPTVETSLKLFLGSIWEWLMGNPPWTVGIVAVIALLLWYFLHALPKKRDNRNLERYMLDKLNREEEVKRTEQQYLAKKKADADAAKRERQDYFDRKRAEEKASREREEHQRADSAIKAEEDRLEREKQEEEQRKAVGTAFELRIVALIKDKLPDWLDTGRAKLLHNVTLPAPYNAQIDAILIDTSGIYVIECKCWDRLIVGKYDWPYWFAIKVIFKNLIPVVSENDQSFYCQAFKSPVEQNEGHKNSLSLFLNQKIGKKFKQFKRITVFDTCGKTSFIMPADGLPNKYSDPYTWVGKKGDLIEAINEYDQITPTVSRLEQKEVNAIFAALKPFANQSISSATAAAVNN